jgi:hypothetical protein
MIQGTLGYDSGNIRHGPVMERSLPQSWSNSWAIQLTVTSMFIIIIKALSEAGPIVLGHAVPIGLLHV